MGEFFYFLKSLKTNPAYSTGYKNYINFYSVHDCYGITAKHVDLLINILRSIYIEIYSNEIFIQKFDKDIIKLIKDSYGNGIFCEKDRIFTIECVKYKLPSISKLI